VLATTGPAWLCALVIAAGELAALGTACCWSISPLLFEAATRRIGPDPVNLLRVGMALLMMLGTGLLTSRPAPLPTQAQLLLLGTSGVIGFALGDFCLLAAYGLIGARLTLLVNTAVPLIAGLGGFLALGERLGLRAWLGMGVTVLGVAWVITARSEPARAQPRAYRNGLLFALGSSLGQAVGLLLSKRGLRGYHAWAGTELRLAAGLVAIAAMVAAHRRGRAVVRAVGDRRALAQLAVASLFGPFLGVFLSLVAVERTATGVAATLMSLPPVLILLPARLLGEAVTWRAGLGAAAAVAGVVVMLS
jgi:drug/metabolite transporter (DMT)-like permease